MRTTLNPSLVVHIRFHFNHFYDTPRVTVIFMLTTLPRELRKFRPVFRGAEPG